MKVYIGNGQRQQFAFMYWTTRGGQKMLRTQYVPIGGQIALADEMDQVEIDRIVQAHNKYGMRHINDIDSPPVEFIGYAYSTDRPFAPQQLRKLLNHNQAILIAKGKRIRELAAMGGAQILENDIEEQRGEERLRTFEVTVQEEFNENTQREEDPFAIGMRVTRDLPGLPPAEEGHRRGRGRLRKAA